MAKARPVRPIVNLIAVGCSLLFLSYWLIFALTTDDGIARSGLQALNNTVPAIGLAVLAHLILDRYVWASPLIVRLIAQIPLSILFGVAWYLAILVIRQFRSGWLTDGFTIEPFVPIAFVWQMFQGITFYALAAVSSFAILLYDRLQLAESLASEAASSLVPKATTTLLIRTTEGTETVSLPSIITILGAGDYAEIALHGRTIMSSTTLAEFETRLPQEAFIRTHRSHIVRLDAIDRSEPAGNGRTILHLVDGRSLTTSRVGTRLLHEAAL